MAKKKLYKSKSNFTLRRLHQSGSYGNIYERDYTTLINSVSSTDSQISIYNSPSFKLTVRAGFNGQKKYHYGNWIANPNSCTDSNNAWTLGCMPEPNRKDGKILLKPNTKRLTDYACYGSAYELIRTSLTDIVSKFPAELYVTEVKLSDTGILTNGSIVDDSDILNLEDDLYVVDNPMYIDIIQPTLPENSQVSPLRYFCVSEYEYDIIDNENKILKKGSDLKKWNEDNPNEKPKRMWSVVSSKDKNCLRNGDLLAIVTIGGVEIYCYFYEETILYLSANSGYRIRPNNNVINDFFNNLDDFEKILLNQYTDYTAVFETYIEDDENGWYLIEKKYKWPLSDGKWNLSVNGLNYSNYVDDLSKLAIGYDELYTNAISRDMTHESITNMDLTIDDSDYENNTSKLKQVLNVIGRQFDEIKKYADNIKNTNQITYDQNQNTPDYFLSDNLNNSGWEVKEILNEIPDTIITNPMYGARTIGFTAGDANNEFLRRLQLNSKNILSKKGTKQCIEDLMALFGYHSTDWLKKYYNKLKDNHLRKAYVLVENVYVANGYANDVDADSVVNEVKRINQLKDTYNTENINNPEAFIDDFQGLPVAEVTFGDKTRLIPWFDKTLDYDSGLYFQMKGGWARNDGNEEDEQSLFGYTISKINYVHTIEELYQIPYSSIDENSVYYVSNEDLYYKVKNIDKHQNSDGWMIPTDEEMNQILNIIDSNKGNNPHSGLYDNGLSYLEAYGELFKDSLFDNVRNDEVSDRINYGFNINRQADSTKCLFFRDLYYGKDDPSVNWQITDNKNDETYAPNRVGEFWHNTNVNKSYIFTTSSIEGKTLISENENLKDSYYWVEYELDDSASLRGTNKIVPFNFFGDNPYSEEASLSIINSKELHITFDDAHRDFLEKDVIPYIKQIIPSTTIFSYSFVHLTGDDDNAFKARTHKIVCDADVCPIFGVTE